MSRARKSSPVSGTPGLGRRFLLALAFLNLMLLSAAHAFQLTPITKDFEPSGRGASQSFQLENKSAETVAIQISMLTRDVDPDGVEKNLPADDEFIVYPSQVLLKPGRIQTIRVQWAGEARPDRELAYRILAEQLPIQFSPDAESGAKINVVLRYLGSVYIVPEGADSDVVAEAQGIGTGDERKLELLFENRGTRHTLLHDLTVNVSAGDQSVALSPEQLKGLAGENLLAGAKRRILLPWPTDLPETAVEAAFDFKRRR